MCSGRYPACEPREKKIDELHSFFFIKVINFNNTSNNVIYSTVIILIKIIIIIFYKKRYKECKYSA